MKHNFNPNILRVAVIAITLCVLITFICILGKVNSLSRLSRTLAAPEHTAKSSIYPAPSFVSSGEDTLIYKNGLFVKIEDIDSENPASSVKE